MSGHAHGGNDRLVGGDDANPVPAGTFDNTLVGDAQSMSGRAVGGNDKLVSGTGNDDMWGDAQFVSGNAKGGNDTFAFNFGNGHDRIEDFGQANECVGSSILGTDRIDVRALGINNFSQLQISAFDPTTHDSTITFSSGNDVVVHSSGAHCSRLLVCIGRRAVARQSRHSDYGVRPDSVTGRYRQGRASAACAADKIARVARRSADGLQFTLPVDHALPSQHAGTDDDKMRRRRRK